MIEFSFIPQKSEKPSLIPRSSTSELMFIYTSALRASGINNAVSTFLRVQTPSIRVVIIGKIFFIAIIDNFFKIIAILSVIAIILA